MLGALAPEALGALGSVAEAFPVVGGAAIPGVELGAVGSDLAATGADALSAAGDAGGAIGTGGDAASSSFNLENVLNNAAKQALIRGGTSALSGQCVLKGALAGAVTGGIGTAGACLLGGCLAANVISKAGAGALGAGITGGNIGKGALSGGAGALLSGVVPGLTKDVIGCLSPATQNMINQAIAGAGVAGAVGSNPLYGAGFGAAGSLINSSGIVPKNLFGSLFNKSSGSCGGSGCCSGGGGYCCDGSGGSLSNTNTPGQAAPSGALGMIGATPEQLAEYKAMGINLPQVGNCPTPCFYGVDSSGQRLDPNNMIIPPTDVNNQCIPMVDLTGQQGGLPGTLMGQNSPIGSSVNTSSGASVAANPSNSALDSITNNSGNVSTPSECTGCGVTGMPGGNVSTNGCGTTCGIGCGPEYCYGFTDCGTCGYGTGCGCCSNGGGGGCGGGSGGGGGGGGGGSSTAKKPLSSNKQQIPCVCTQALLLKIGKTPVDELNKLVTDPIKEFGPAYGCAKSPELGCQLPVNANLGYGCLPVGGLSGFASGGSTCDKKHFCFKQYEPNFADQNPEIFVSKGSNNKATLMELKQLKPTINSLAQGGLPEKYHAAAPAGHKPEFITGITGYYACGGGTGQSDDIPAMLHDGDYVMDAETVSALGDGSSKAGMHVLEGFRSQIPHKNAPGGNPVPAKIADGEYVFPAAFVSALGRGDNKRGSEILDGLREKLRAHKRGAPLDKIPPKAKSPLDYIQKGKK